jgi:hypothetical protein
VTATVSTKAESGCDTKDGLIFVSGVSGGTEPYSYYIDGVINPAGANNSVFSGLTAKTTYSIRVEAANGCSFTTSATVTSPCAPVCNLTASAIKQDVSCHGARDGALTVSVSGASGMYEYSLDGGVTYQANASFTSLQAATHSITIRDKNDNTCTTSLDVIINQPALLTLTLTSKTDVSGCNGDATGSITVTATGGTGAYTYSIDGSTFSSSNVFNALTAGIYSNITVKDVNGCTTGLPSVSITEPAAIQADVARNNPTGCSATDGSIQITNVTGGSGNYEYSLNGGTYQASAGFNDLPDGTYTISIRDKNSVTCVVTKNAVLSSGNGLSQLQ